MELNLEQAFDAPVDLSHTFEVPVARLDRPELVSLGPVRFAGQLQKAEPGFILTGRIELSGSVSCARCLTEVPFSRAADVAWNFAPEHEKPNEEELELKNADLDLFWYDELSFPFDPLIDEEIQLELPLKALCKDDCQGLCPNCGADRNVTACGCAEPLDDRWATLKTLMTPGS